MNTTQLKYARVRAEAIYHTRLKSLKEAHTVPEVKLGPAEKRKALNARQFKVIEEPDRYNVSYLSSYIKFNAERDAVFDREAYDLRAAVLRTDFDKLTDELVLGDHEEALKLLRAFEAQ